MEDVEAIKRKSHSVILDILPIVRSEELLEDMDLFSLGLDSVNAIMLVMSLQNTFGVNFETTEISLENFRTIEDIVKLIKRKKRAEGENLSKKESGVRSQNDDCASGE